MATQVQQIDGNERNRWEDRPPSEPPGEAQPAGRPVGSGTSKLLYGGTRQGGVSMEWQEFDAGAAFDWAHRFHPESLELCLNLTGGGVVCCGESRADFQPLTAGFYLPGKAGLQAWRHSGQQHRFVTVVFSVRFLRQRLAGFDGALHPTVEGFLESGGRQAGLSAVQRLGASQEHELARLLHPPCPQAARPLWYQSRVLALMTEFFFERRGAEELLCDRQKRVARERVDRVLSLLRAHLAEPLSLEEIGRQVGCSPSYLSRTFSTEMGMTISQSLRKLRMERAAELLRSGTCNVTEAALEVGYSSLSHFSQAFCQTMGCCPGMYPAQRQLSTPSPPAAGAAHPAASHTGCCEPGGLALRAGGSSEGVVVSSYAPTIRQGQNGRGS